MAQKEAWFCYHDYNDFDGEISQSQPIFTEKIIYTVKFIEPVARHISKCFHFHCLGIVFYLDAFFSGQILQRVSSGH